LPGGFARTKAIFLLDAADVEKKGLSCSVAGHFLPSRTRRGACMLLSEA
jgi:hypothetical protein